MKPERAVIDLMVALKALGGTPTLQDLKALARRVKRSHREGIAQARRDAIEECARLAQKLRDEEWFDVASELRALAASERKE